MPETTFIMHPGYATGDQFAILAKLANDPNAKVIVGELTAPQPEDKSASLLQIYAECGFTQDNGRVILLKGSKNRNTFNGDARDWAEKEKEAGRIGDYRCANLGEGTKYVSKEWTPEARDTVRANWRVGEKGDEVKAWLQENGINHEQDVQGKRVAVLWSRFSGKGGAAHPEHDTSMRGMQQMVENLSPHFDTIVIVGDKHPVKGDHTFDRLESTDTCKVKDLTTFWNNKTQSLADWTENKRLGQLRLYDHLERNSAAIVHLGARSGNLEALALMGHKVGYLEQKHSMGGPRMDAWKEAPSLDYHKVLIDQVPTATGKFLTTRNVTKVAEAHTLEQQEEAIRNEQQVNAYAQHDLGRLPHLPRRPLPEGVADTKDPQIRALQKGFEPHDLKAIEHFAQTSSLETCIKKQQALIATLPETSLGELQAKSIEMGKLVALQEKLSTALGDQVNFAQQRVDAAGLKVTEAEQLQNDLGPLLTLEKQIAGKQEEISKIKNKNAKKTRLQGDVQQLHLALPVLQERLATDGGIPQARYYKSVPTPADARWAQATRQQELDLAQAKLTNVNLALDLSRQEKQSVDAEAQKLAPRVVRTIADELHLPEIKPKARGQDALDLAGKNVGAKTTNRDLLKTPAHGNGEGRPRRASISH